MKKNVQRLQFLFHSRALNFVAETIGVDFAKWNLFYIVNDLISYYAFNTK